MFKMFDEGLPFEREARCRGGINPNIVLKRALEHLFSSLLEPRLDPVQCCSCGWSRFGLVSNRALQGGINGHTEVDRPFG